MKKFLFLLFIGGMLISSCKSDKDNAGEINTGSLSGDINSQNQTSGEIINQEPAGPLTNIKFKEEAYDFGTVKDGVLVEHEYEFVNDGDNPLVLKNVKASCGCTTPSWPRDPIAPGKTGRIHAAFDTKGRGSEGGSVQNKTITVIGNFEGGSIVLTLRGLIDIK
jgi:hypothetical protein